MAESHVLGPSWTMLQDRSNRPVEFCTCETHVQSTLPDRKPALARPLILCQPIDMGFGQSRCGLRERRLPNAIARDHSETS